MPANPEFDGAFFSVVGDRVCLWARFRHAGKVLALVIGGVYLRFLARPAQDCQGTRR
jgi:hypothetical protein